MLWGTFNGCAVFVTIELVILAFEDEIYSRIMDDTTGFKELSASS